MIRSAFHLLESDFDGSPGSPIGLCVLAGADERRRWPAVAWSDPRLVHAGYLADGRQVRIGYFRDAVIAGSGPAASRAGTSAVRSTSGEYRVELFAEQDRVRPQDIVDLWLREGAVPPEEAERRVSEVLLIATGADGRPVGVSTTYLRRSERLQAYLWHMRAFVTAGHRRSRIGFDLALAGRDALADRFVSGADRRGIGILWEVQNDLLKRLFPQAIWPRTEFVFIGETPSGSHLRVYYFPGAQTPEPAQGRA